jgi:predicted transcriptional regulator
MIAELPASSDKQLALLSLRRMSDEASMKEISEEFAILAALRAGEAAADAGRVLTHDELKRRSATWTTK